MSADPTPVTRPWITKILGGIAGIVNKRFDELEARLSVLEQREVKSLADSFKGAWLPGSYQRGDLISHRGSAWLCVASGEGKPGESGTWRLVVQRGKDGKDAA